MIAFRAIFCYDEPMKKVFLVFAIALLAVSCSSQQNTALKSDKLQAYRNASYNFEFQYPSEFEFVQPEYFSLREPIVQLSLPKEQYPKTNFGDAGFAVSYSASKNQKECLDASFIEKNKSFDRQQVIDGETFYVTAATGAAAGNIYQSRIFRIFKDHLCFEIQQTVHTSNIGNYTPGAVSAVDQAPIWTKLDVILFSFKFIKGQ